jgi:hypothetical protein
MARSHGSKRRNADMILGRTSTGAIKIKTDGGLRAVECGCCEPAEDFQEFSEVHWYDECPTVGPPCPFPNTNSQPSCANQTITGQLISKPFPNYVKIGKTPKADVRADFDDFGYIGSLSCNETGLGFCKACGVQGTIQPQVHALDEKTFVLKIPFQATNAYWGGPYSISCSARFYFE